MKSIKQELLAKYPNIELWMLTKTKSINPSNKYPDGFWVIGNIIQSPVVGSHLLIARLANSIHNCENYGIFNTSTITNILQFHDEIVITTRNSEYKLEKLTIDFGQQMNKIYDELVKSGIDPYEG